MSKTERFSPESLRDTLLGRLQLPADAVLHVAYSGGVDSQVLLHALCALRDRPPWRVHAVHVDHGLHPDSARWAAQCGVWCRELGVPLTVEAIEVPRDAAEGLEAAARRLRYQHLARHVCAGEVLLTAHHQDDQAETVLLHLLRGAGLPGLAAMPADMPFAHGRHVRPLLGYTRAALLAYARGYGLAWIEDTSNRDLRYARNYLRHEVLPRLRARWPAVAAVLSRTAGHAAEAQRLLDELAAADRAAAARPDQALSVPALARLSPARQRNLLRGWLRQQGLPAPPVSVLEQILRQTRSLPASRHARVCWSGVELRRYRDAWYAVAPRPPPPRDLQVRWEPSAPLTLPELGCRLELVPARGAGVALSRLQGPVTVRLRQGGETCVLRGHRHKLKKLLQEAGVPPWQRPCLPLIYLGEELAAVADLWVCEPHAAAGDEPGVVVVRHPLAPEPAAHAG